MRIEAALDRADGGREIAGGARAAQTVANSGLPLAVAAAGGPLGIERPADGIPLLDHGNELVAKRFLGRVRLGPVVVAFAEQVVVLEQDLADGVAAAVVVEVVVAPAAHDRVEDLDLDLAKADKAGTFDLKGAAVAIPSSSVAARGGPSRVCCATVPVVAPDAPLRAVGDSTARLEGQGAPTGATRLVAAS